eukprot:jgi/Mesvir1/19073/Mv12829-RA.1
MFSPTVIRIIRKMMDEDTGMPREDTQVNVDELETIARESVESVIGPTTFQLNKMHLWTSNIIEHCLKKLAALTKPYKFIVTCNLLQRTGAGFHVASTALWDTSTDGKHTILWENPTMHCIITIYWLGI